MNKDLKDMIFHDFILYFVLGIFVYFLEKNNHIDSWSFICGMLSLPITDFIYKLLKKIKRSFSNVKDKR